MQICIVQSSNIDTSRKKRRARRSRQAKRESRALGLFYSPHLAVLDVGAKYDVEARLAGAARAARSVYEALLFVTTKPSITSSSHRITEEGIRTQQERINGSPGRRDGQQRTPTNTHRQALVLLGVVSGSIKHERAAAAARSTAGAASNRATGTEEHQHGGGGIEREGCYPRPPEVCREQ